MASCALVMSILGMVFIIIAIIVHIVCIVTPFMVGIDLTPFKSDLINYGSLSQSNIVFTEIEYGPWRSCMWYRLQVLDEDGVDCGKIEEASGALEAVRAFSILAVLTGIATLIISIINLIFLGRSKSLLAVLTCVGNLVAGALVVVEIAILGLNYEHIMFNDHMKNVFSQTIKTKVEEASYLYWGFGVEIIAVLLFILSGLMHLVGRREAKVDYV